MNATSGKDGEWKRLELQLDTAQILLVIAMLLGLCAACFYLGRWIERDQWQEISARAAPSKNGKITETDAGADMTFFDKLGSRSAEPVRQARSDSTPASKEAQSTKPDADTAEGPDEAGSTSSSAGAAHPAPRSQAGAASSTPSSASTSHTGTAQESWAVQVFAGDPAQAEKIVASLTRRGYSARIAPGSRGAGSARVRVVGYRSRAEAQEGANRLKREANLKPWVVKLD